MVGCQEFETNNECLNFLLKHPAIISKLNLTISTLKKEVCFLGGL